MPKKNAKKLITTPFQPKTSKTQTTVHVLIGVEDNGNVVVYHTHPSDTLEEAIDELLSMKESKHGSFEVHHLATRVALPKPPRKVRTVKAKKVRTIVTEAPADAPEGAGTES